MTRNSTTILAALALVIITAGTYAHIAVRNASFTEATVLCPTARMPQVTAEAAYVYDITKGRAVFEKEGEAQLPLASLTKLVTALVTVNTLPETKTVSISENALTPEGDSGFVPGESWEMKDLLAFTLMTSSNDGARALALAASNGSIDEFITKMNQLVKTIGLSQTFFLNETGLDVSSSTAGAYGSARDIALLLSHIYNHDEDVLSGSTQAANVYTSLSGITHTAEHTSSVAGEIPGELVVKTGFTDLAGGNLAVLAEVLPGRPVAIVVLGATRESRDTDVRALATAARDALKREALCAGTETP